MILLIPVDKKDYKEAKIAKLYEKNIWITIEMENGFVKNYSFFDNKESITDFIDYVIVKEKDENIEEFLDRGIDVLFAPLQDCIEDIVEAYKFKELHEI